MQIAPVQRQLLEFLEANLEVLDGYATGQFESEVAELRSRLNSWAAKVAVIGQVKAGKSTFLNAFLGQHDFLPSDINPWTSVVTNIRINLPGDPETGAEFNFFNEHDWHEMLNGTHHVREMAEELLPGFDTELLKKQSLELKERAQRRLGAHYRALLGSKHAYEFVTPDLLRRYVCAGPGSDDGLTRESLGRYAALTRDAEIYMQIPDFQVPTVVTDTPGVNDPFLVRDEVTCRSLDKSDVFVMVLSAHQALTDVDIGLIRILAQQDGKDVIIFINRLDELEGYDTRYERLISDVSARLEAAIPGISFHIMTGSGFMADAVLRDDEEGEDLRKDLDDETLAAYLQNRFGTVPETQEARLRLGSGIDEIRTTLSNVIDGGLGCNQLTQLTQDMFTQISAMLLATKHERNSLAQDLAQLQAGDFGKLLSTLDEDIDKIKEAQSTFDTKLHASSAELDETTESALVSLRRDLEQIAYMFIIDQRASLEARLDSQSKLAGKSHEIDLTELHFEMETSLTNRFASTRKRIDALLEDCMQDCEAIIKDNFDEDIEHLSIEDLPNETFVTTLAMSKKTLQAEIVSEQSWQFLAC
ncbi:MAG: dynamin family protein [Pseudomonadota bacterium]